MIKGEIWSDGPDAFVVKSVKQASFFKCSPDIVLPNSLREYDSVLVELDHKGIVDKIHKVYAQPVLRSWPHKQVPSKGAHIGRIIEYSDGKGRLKGYKDEEYEFHASVVKAIGNGEVVVGEVVEYECSQDDTSITRVSGPFNTHVSICGKLLQKS